MHCKGHRTTGPAVCVAILAAVLTACSSGPRVPASYSESVAGVITAVEGGSFHPAPRSSAVPTDKGLYSVRHDEYAQRFLYTLELEGGAEAKIESPNRMRLGDCALLWYEPGGAAPGTGTAQVQGYLTRCDS